MLYILCGIGFFVMGALTALLYWYSLKMYAVSLIEAVNEKLATEERDNIRNAEESIYWAPDPELAERLAYQQKHPETAHPVEPRRKRG